MADLGAIGKTPVMPGKYRARLDGPQFHPGMTVRGSGITVAWKLTPLPTRVLQSKTVSRSIFTPPWWGSRPIGSLPLPDFKIQGHVYQLDDEGNQVPLHLCRVRLHYKPNGASIATAATDAAGFYQFKNLMPDAAAYYAVAFDPEGDPNQNALILDKLSTVAV